MLRSAAWAVAANEALRLTSTSASEIAEPAISSNHLPHAAELEVVFNTWKTSRICFEVDGMLLNNLSTRVTVARSMKERALALLSVGDEDDEAHQNEMAKTEEKGSDSCQQSIFQQMNKFATEYSQLMKDPERAVLIPEAEEISIAVQACDDWLCSSETVINAPTSLMALGRLQDQAVTFPQNVCEDKSILQTMRYKAHPISCPHFDVHTWYYMQVVGRQSSRGCSLDQRG